MPARCRPSRVGAAYGGRWSRLKGLELSGGKRDEDPARRGVQPISNSVPSMASPHVRGRSRRDDGAGTGSKEAPLGRMVLLGEAARLGPHSGTWYIRCPVVRGNPLGGLPP
jgi:hypothetical protein